VEGAVAKEKGLTFLRNEQGKIVCGTLPWMAPERFEGKADIRSDIYSFGIVLY
jgi:serine/threonine protein kinase